MLKKEQNTEKDGVKKDGTLVARDGTVQYLAADQWQLEITSRWRSDRTGAEYPARWVRDEHVFWNEQYLVQAFLAFNSAFEVWLAESGMRPFSQRVGVMDGIERHRTALTGYQGLHLFHDPRHQRPRTDQAHLAPQDIYQLRQLIELSFAHQ